jgi:hypothetical protein
MFRVRNDRRRWRLRWPWRWLFPIKVVERYCRECGLPYNDGPLPGLEASYRSGNVGAQVFPAGSSCRDELVVRVGRWQRSWGRPFLGDFIPESEMGDLVSVASQARAAYRERTADRRARR